MEFQFEQGDEGIIGELAVAAYGDNSFCISHAGHPLNAYDITRIVGISIRELIAKDTQLDSWVARRDEIHRIIRLFAEAMGAEPAAIAWHRVDEEEPTMRHIQFVVQGSSEVRAGIYNKDTKTYVASNGQHYAADDVTYWCPPVHAPIVKDEELQNFPSA